MDALAGKDLSGAAMERGHGMLLYLGICHPQRLPTKLNGGMETLSRTGDLTVRGDAQLGESPIIQGEHPLLGMVVHFYARTLSQEGRMKFVG